MSRAHLTGRKIAVEVRGEDLFVGDVPVTTDPRSRIGPAYRLSDETAVGLGLVELFSDGGFYRQDASWVRLHFCRLCRWPFIANKAARLCSSQCLAKALQARREAQHGPRRLIPSKAAQRRYTLAHQKCEVCGGAVQARRITARFCSNKCRQHQHRQKLRAVAQPDAGV